MGIHDQHPDLHRDVTAARAELIGRRDQLIAETDERLGALEKLEDQVAAGELELRTAQAKLRQLVADRAPRARGPAGITTGVRVRAGAGSDGPAIPGVGGLGGEGAPGRRRRTTGPIGAPSAAMISAHLSKVQGRVETRLLALLVSPPATRPVDGTFELSLLVRLHRGIGAQQPDVPTDPVLLESLQEFCQHADDVVAGLETGGADRTRRLIEHGRELTSELRALGVDPTPLKGALRQLAEGLAGNGDDVAVARLALDAYHRIRGHLVETHHGQGAASWLDSLLTQT